MYSQAELDQTIAKLNQTKTEIACGQIFGEVLNRIPANHPKREDFLWKIGRSVQARLKDEAAEWLAYAASGHAADYAYDWLNLGEAAKALNIVFESAQKASSTSKGQQILVGAMKRSADDTFAIRLLEYTENKDRNKILTNFNHIDPNHLRIAFIERMRKRYGKDVDATRFNLAQGDWRAFREWTDHSADDNETERDFLRRYIGASRKKLAQVLNFIFPTGVTWSEDPRPLIDKLFPLSEAQQLIENLQDDAQLDDVESSAITRFKELLGGKWFDIRYPDAGKNR